MFPVIRKLILTSGNEIAISEGVTVIVGPNNVGKSLLLREIDSWLVAQNPATLLPRPLMLQAVTMDEWPDPDQFVAWLETIHPRRPPGHYTSGSTTYDHFLFSGQQAPVPQVQQIVQNQTSHMGVLSHAFVLYLGPDGRLGIASQTNTQNILSEPPQHPLHYLYRNRDLEAKLSASTQRAFGMPLTLNRYSGSLITLHVGKTSAQETMPPSQQYIAELMALPLVQDQGDGVRAFLGVLLSIFVTLRPLIIIDEPEAFLHPPQAYLLGRILAEWADQGVQVLTATHSQDFMRGVTSAGSASGRVSVVRITRPAPMENRSHQISADAIRSLYLDPLIKYYSILDGLFSHGVVLCEADSDCTYYRAVFESCENLSFGLSDTPLDLHFTHCGGKARIPRAVKALRAAGVPVACAVDFDFFRDDANFRDLVSACGGRPQDLQTRRSVLINAVEGKARKVSRAAAKLQIDNVLNSGDGADLSSKELRIISAALKASSGWEEAKKLGRSLLSGQAVTAFDSLDSDLRGLGIFVVPIGELERFHPEISADNKAEWLRKVLEGGMYRNCTAAKDYFEKVVSGIRSQQ